jgi:hypothetical protein
LNFFFVNLIKNFASSLVQLCKFSTETLVAKDIIVRTKAVTSRDFETFFHTRQSSLLLF